MTEKTTPRWWPLIVAVGVYLIALGSIWWLWQAPSTQDRVIRTVLASFLMAIVVLCWLMLLSRLAWKTRLLSLFALGVAGVALSQMLTVRGVSGDLIPILAWNWSPPADGALAQRPAASPSQPPALARETSPDDFPQYLGPDRDATVPGVALARSWEVDAPELVWRQPTGAGWSGFAVVGRRAVTLEQRGAHELTAAYDLTTGKALWYHEESTRFESVIAGDGPRATPTIHGGRVYSVGATGVFNVLDLETGRRIWSTNILDDNDAAVPIYGVSASPLIHHGKVLVVAGDGRSGSLVAYDPATGEKLWNGGDDRGRYSSPAVATLAGREQILLFYSGALRGHDPDNGEVLWEFPWPTATEETSQPVPLSADRVFLSSGYGVGSKVIRVEVDAAGAWSATLDWESRSLKAKFTNVVVRDQTIYGLDDGILVAVDAQTGERHWKRGRFGHGHVLLVGDLLLVLSERGEVALIDPQPDDYRELGRFEAIEGKTWNTPALAGAYLLVRNDREAACYRLPLAAGSG